MIRAVFTDVDNTLTSPVTRSIPASAREAIRLARQKGVLVFAATGRNTRTPEEGGIIANLPLDGYVAVNGQLCYLADGTFVHKAPMDPALVSGVAKAAVELGFSYSVSEADRVYLNYVSENTRIFHELLRIPIPRVDSLEGVENREVYSITPYIDAATEAALHERVAGCLTARHCPYACDVIPSAGGKEVGICTMLARFGISPQECMAFGDGANDIAMLAYAGIGVAMGGCCQAAADAADYLAPSPDADGFFRTLERFGVI